MTSDLGVLNPFQPVGNFNNQTCSPNSNPLSSLKILTFFQMVMIFETAVYEMACELP